MTDIQLARSVVTAMYPDRQGWRKKVNAMPDNQVLAIFIKHMRDEQKQDDQDDTPF